MLLFVVKDPAQDSYVPTPELARAARDRSSLGLGLGDLSTLSMRDATTRTEKKSALSAAEANVRYSLFLLRDIALRSISIFLQFLVS